MTDKSKNKNNSKKRQIIVGTVCLFVVLGSFAGSGAYNIFKFPRLISLMDFFYSEGSFMKMFVISALLPYAIIISSFFSWGIPVSLFITFFQSFICSWHISKAIAPYESFSESFKNIPLNFILIACTVASCFYSINKIMSKFAVNTKYKTSLKREKTKNNTENIIIFFFVTITIALYCIIREKIM